MEFKVYVVVEDDNVFVFNDMNDGMKDVFGEALQEHTVTLKTPLTQALATEQDRLMWVTNALGGLLKDEARRSGAFAASFIASWTFKNSKGEVVPVTYAGFESLHPQVAGSVYARAEALVYPNPLASAAFRIFNDRQESGAAPA